MVISIIQRERRPFRIILHGESIGGMVACHLARRVPVDALVCDRTFATLDATAARLMVRFSRTGCACHNTPHILSLLRGGGLAWG